MALKRERRYFESIKLQLLLDHKGKFVLIKGEDLVGIFDSEGSALEEGYKRFGQSEPFLVHKIEYIEKTVNLMPTISVIGY